MSNISSLSQNSKTVGMALLLALFFGPAGLFYSRPIAAVLLTVACIVFWGTVVVPVVCWLSALLMAPWGVIQQRESLRLELSG